MSAWWRRSTLRLRSVVYRGLRRWGERAEERDRRRGRWV